MNAHIKSALVALLLIISCSVVYADNSRVIGNVSSKVTGSLVTNIAAGYQTEAMTGSIVLDSSELHGNVKSEVRATITIINTAIGIDAHADLGSVILTNAVVRGDINILVQGMSLINVAIGNGTRSGLGSVIAR